MHNAPEGHEHAPVSPRRRTSAAESTKGTSTTSVAKRAPRKQQKPREETARRREDILKAAMETFGAKGYYNGSLVEIAEKVGMTHAGVLHHFGSKDKLLIEVLAYRDLADAAPAGLDLFTHLVDTARANAGRPGIVKTYAVLSADSVTDNHPAQQWFRDRFQGLRELIVDASRAVCEPDNMPDEKAITIAAASIIAVMDGLQVQWLLDPDRLDLAEATAFAINAILVSLVAGDRRPTVL
jgi:AcrR family transcriptional regulator